MIRLEEARAISNKVQDKLQIAKKKAEQLEKSPYYSDTQEIIDLITEAKELAVRAHGKIESFLGEKTRR